MSKILFSPVGGTDPIRNLHDGSILHIIRYYQPDKVVLYMSEEMYARHKRDNRYVYCIEQMQERIGKQIKVEIFHEDVTVQDYEIFYMSFKKIISGIIQDKEENDELLVNIASGTPAMKSALVLLAGMGEYRFTAVQVATPLKRSNFTDENTDEYDAAEQWSCNMDNEPEAENRCRQIQSANLQLLLQIETVKEHLRAYDYSAAETVMAGISSRMHKKPVKMIEQALARANRDYFTVKKLADEIGYMPVPVRGEKDRGAVEYLLAMQVRIYRRQFEDFIRGLSPIIMELMERTLLNVCKIDYHQYCTEKKGEKWDMSKLNGTELLSVLQQDHPRIFSSSNYETVYSRHLKTIINYYSNDAELNNLMNQLRSIEETVRNSAAHTLILVTDDLVKSWTGYTCEQIFGMLRKSAQKVHLIQDKSIWNSYDDMNEAIIEELKKGIAE